MIRAARFKPSLLSRTIAFGLIFLCSAAAFADEALWKMYMETGTEAYEASRYATAETMFLAARTEAEGFGSNDVRLASTLFQLARVYNAESNDEKAKLTCRRAIEIWDAHSASASIGFADDLRKLLTNLAGELRSREKYDEADPLYKRAQDIAEKHFGPDDPRLAETLTARAVNFYAGKKYAQAEPLYERALAIKQKKQSTEHPDVVEAIRPLASTLFAQNKFDQAGQLTERAIGILEKTKEPETSAETNVSLKEPATLTFLNDLAGDLRDQKNYDAAEPLYKRAQEIAEKHFGPDDPRLAETLTARAVNFCDEEKYAQAELLYERALAIKQKKQGTEHPDVVEAIRPLASTLFAQNKFDQAGQLTERAIGILEKTKEPETSAETNVSLKEPATLTFLNDLAGDLRDKKNYDAAELLYKRAQEIVEKHFGPDDPRLAEALTARAVNFCDEEKYAQADPLYTRVLAFTEKKQGNEASDLVKNAIRPLAVRLFELRKFDQARLLTERAIRILEKNNKPEDLTDPLTFLGQTCEGLRKYDDAERAYKRALHIVGRDNTAAVNTLENYSRMLRDLKREKEAKALEAHLRKIQTNTKNIQEGQ